MLRTWAGPLPEWTPKFIEHVKHLEQFGWDFRILNFPTQDSLDLFCQHAKGYLGCSIAPKLGSRKICEFDPALAVIFPTLVNGYDFWGHFNLDCVYGRIDKWLPDSLLNEIDIFGNDPGAICGPFSVYRNTPKVNLLFMETEHWRDIFQSDDFYGFDEGAFSSTVRKAAIFHDIRFLSANWHSHDKMPMHYPPKLKIDGEGNLIECNRDKVFMFHFNETRRWPIAA